MPNLDTLPESLRLEIQSYFSSEEKAAYHSTHKRAYINNIEELFFIIAIGNQPDATETQKKPVPSAWTELSKHLFSRLHPNQRPLLTELEKTKFGETQGLLANLQALDRQLAKADAFVHVKVTALEIGLRVSLHQPVTVRELRFLYKLANMPGYYALGLLSLLPLLSQEQIHLICARFESGQYRMNLEEEKFLWSAIVSRMTLQKRTTLFYDMKWQNMQPLVALVKENPEWGEKCIQVALVELPESIDGDESILTPAEDLLSFFEQCPDLLTKTLMQILIDKVDEPLKSIHVNTEREKLNKANLIEIVTQCAQLRPDLLAENELRQNVLAKLLKNLAQWSEFALLSKAIGTALVELSDILGKGHITQALLSNLAPGISIHLQCSSLKILTKLFEKYPGSITEACNAELRYILIKTKSKNAYVKQKALKALMVIIQMNPPLIALRPVKKVLNLYKFQSFRQASLRHTTIKVLATRVKNAQNFERIRIIRLIINAMADDDDLVKYTAYATLADLLDSQPDLANEDILAQVRRQEQTIPLPDDDDHRLVEALTFIEFILYKHNTELIDDRAVKQITAFSALHLLPDVIRALNAIFEKKPEIVTPEIIQNILNAPNDCLEIWPQILLLYEIRPKLFQERIENILLKRLKDNGNTVSTKFLENIRLIRLITFFNEHPYLLTKHPAIQEAMQELSRNIQTVDSISVNFILKTVHRHTPTAIVDMPILKHPLEIQFDASLEKLKTTTSRLIQNGKADSPTYDPNYLTVSQYAAELITSLETARNTLFMHSFAETSPEVLLHFQETVNAAIERAEREFINHRSIWAKVPHILKAILGVLALIPLGIPAILVEKYSTQGYVGTFFNKNKSKPRAYTALRGFKAEVGSLLQGNPPTMPTSRGVASGSRNLATSLDPAVTPRDVGLSEEFSLRP